jgi:2-polyprenyl-6-methoxyphenol hydroxylase-like FAD-dependent oxidoreductase
MALIFRPLGPQGGSRLRRGLRAAFRGSVAAFGVARLHLVLRTAGGVFLHGDAFSVLSPLAGSE